MTYQIPRDSNLTGDYFDILKNRIYKILPLIEEKNDGVYQYVDSLVFELYGLQYVIEGVKKTSMYITLLCTLESLLDEFIIGEVFEEENKFNSIRSEIFKLISLIDKLQKGG